MDQLLDKGIDFSNKKLAVQTLKLASLAGHVLWSKDSSKAPGRPQSKTLNGGFNLVMDAAREGKTEILQTLIQAGADINADMFG